jgi:C1A family cysteine protease
MVNKRNYGWKRDTNRENDEVHEFCLLPTVAHAIKRVDLRHICPPIYDQGNLGSCTANAIGAAYEMDQIKQGEAHPFIPSRLFIYYNERAMENSVDQDAGAAIKDGIISINKIGVCPESMWPYVEKNFKTKPPTACYTDAKQHTSVLYRRVQQNLAQMKQCLISGFPFVLGISVYESFESLHVAQTGVVPMPNIQKEQLLGGHAIVCVGFDDASHRFIMRNSWGTSWGQKGYFTIPYNYLTNPELADDIWTITAVKDNPADHHIKQTHQ